jgi:NAD(P)-dependent dehydrogenase (short-subunit alcohol dehydrogenase family)
VSGMLQPEVLVLGGAGTVGAGIVAALLEAGSPVLVVGRDRERLDALKRRFADEPALEVMVGSVADDAAAAQLAAQVAERTRPLAAVVASIGSPLSRGRLLDRPASALLKRLQRDLLPHLAAARHLLPLLADMGGRYVLVGSPCALRAWSGHGDTSIAASATRMLAHVLHEEAQPFGVRVQLLAVDHPVCDPAQANAACVEWFKPLAVGRAAVGLLAGRGMPGQVVVGIDKQLVSRPVDGLLAGVPLPLSLTEVSP